MRYQIKLKKLKIKHVKIIGKMFFWFSVGAWLSFFLLISFSYIVFQQIYKHKIYPGISVGSVSFSGREEKDVQDYFDKKNNSVKNAKFVFEYKDQVATVSAGDINLGYDSNLLAEQTISIGRSKDFFANIYLILNAYFNGINLPVSFTYSQDKLVSFLSPMTNGLRVEPINALFNFENGRVIEFRPSTDGQAVDQENLDKMFLATANEVITQETPQEVFINIPIKVLKPEITTDKVNSFGVKELLASGTSLFQHSIDTRIYNVNLAAGRLNGILVKPGEIFSFDKALGDVSAFTGYKSAYVIQNGKTVLGDGGGVCQVSTTLFRALLLAGLPITERHAHAYRVGYYEEDSSPGLDATVYVPSVDLKFENDTGHYILIQTNVDLNELRLTFYLYGTKDNRRTVISTPVVTAQTPAPPPSYQDDPTLPKGETKQVDFSANGANVYFTRQVTKDNKTVIDEKYVSNYQPWQAVYLRGTK